MWMVSHAELAEKMSEDTALRDSVTHSYHVDAVSQNLTNAAIYGVNDPLYFQHCSIQLCIFNIVAFNIVASRASCSVQPNWENH